ncbi:MAG: DciA family protein [bacterium]
MRRRKGRPQEGLVEIGDLLEGALKYLGAKSDYELFQLGKCCREILGGAGSRALADVSFQKGQVALKFNHSIWLNEMNFRKSEILSALQKELPGMGIKSVNLGLARTPKS